MLRPRPLGRLRRSRRLTLRQVAALAGVSPATVRRIEIGWPVTPAMIERVAAALGVPQAAVTGEAD
jgi:transcriptional regulator with XRE-family HTH domain